MKDNIKVQGHVGTWHVIDHLEINGWVYYLLEHDEYGEDAACVITDEIGTLVMDNVWNGFDDLEE